MERREFVKLSAAIGCLFPFNVKGWQMHPGGLGVTPDIRQQSIFAFERFKAVWQFEDFWKRGNTFDGCLKFAAALYNKYPDDPAVKAIQQDVADMLEVNYTYFNSIDPQAMWADDFGWWGIMGLNARTHLLRLGNTSLADKYYALSINHCWRQQKEHAYDPSNSGRPVAHGCTNSAANGQSAGVKNTVTNVLFFLLSINCYRQSLGKKDADQKDLAGLLEMAYQQWKWFDSWFTLTQYQYLKKLPSGAALVQERPIAVFKGSTYQDYTHPTWEKGWLWSGDQGMILAALSGLLAVKKHMVSWIQTNRIARDFNITRFEAKIQHYIQLISRGVQQALIAKADNIIREAPFNASFGPAFGNDYLAGRGILMRYLGELAPHITGINYQENIKATLTAIWATRDPANNQFSPEFTTKMADKQYIAQFKQLTGEADDVSTWQIAAMEEKQKNAVCQAIGLDAYGAYLTISL